MSAPRRLTDHARLRFFLPGLTLAVMLGLILGRQAAVSWPGYAAAGLALLSALMLKGIRRQAALCVCAAGLALALGQAAYHPALPDAGEALITGVITEETSQEGRVRAVLKHVTVNGRPIRGGLYWTAYVDEVPAEITPGRRVSVYGSIYHPSGEENPGGFDFREYLLQKGVVAGLYGMSGFRAEEFSLWPDALAARARRFLENQLSLRLGDTAGSLVSTMLLGSRGMLPQEERAAFSRLGIAHILSVSGFHVSVLAAMLDELMRRRLRYRRGLRIGLLSGLLAAYCLLTGFNPPVIRASLMSVLARLGRHPAHRTPSRLHTLCAAAILTLILQPTALFGASFQLSYSALLALILVEPTLERLLHPNRRWKTALWRLFCASLSVQLGILIPQLWWFGDLALFSIPVNLLLLTVAPVLLGLFWLMLLALPLPLIREAVALPVRLAAEGFVGAVRWAGQLRFLTLSTPKPNLLTFLGVAAMAAGLGWLWRLKGWKRAALTGAGVTLAVLSLAVRLPFTGTEYIQFSVGNADAALLRDRDQVVVIDTGETGEELALYLKDRGLSVDTLIITHLHRDHAGGIAGLLEAGIPVKRCLLPEGAGSTRIDEGMLDLLRRLLDTGTVYGTLRRGDVLDLPSGSLTALWPPGSRVRRGADANDYSLVMMLETHGVTMMLTGDITGGFETYLEEPADILKVAHHGSASSTTEAFLAAAAPQALVLSCGDSARVESVRQRAGGLPLYATREVGAVMIVFSEDGAYTIRGYVRDNDK